MCELDHIFVNTSVGAPEAAHLIELGLTEGEPNTHPGQGTADRRFFFHNAMLELLWVADAEEVKSDSIRQTRLWDRWKHPSHGACPFGICFRSEDPLKACVPFPSWEYRPPYLPSPLAINVVTNVDTLTEPMLFYLSFASRPDRAVSSTRQPLRHSAGWREITRVRWVRPSAEALSPELRAVVEAGALGVTQGDSHQLEIGFDAEVRGQRADLRPHLPLVLSW